LPQIAPYANYPLSHDDVFCTLLTAYELKSEVCHAELGWLAQNRELQEEQRKHLLPPKSMTH